VLKKTGTNLANKQTTTFICGHSIWESDDYRSLSLQDQNAMQWKPLFVQTKQAFSQHWKTSLFARHKLVRELSLVLLVKLVLLYGIINFIAPSATAVDDSDVSTRLLNLSISKQQTTATTDTATPSLRETP